MRLTLSSKRSPVKGAVRAAFILVVLLAAVWAVYMRFGADRHPLSFLVAHVSAEDRVVVLSERILNDEPLLLRAIDDEQPRRVSDQAVDSIMKALDCRCRAADDYETYRKWGRVKGRWIEVWQGGRRILRAYTHAYVELPLSIDSETHLYFGCPALLPELEAVYHHEFE